jgi:hypothetical protein
MNTNTLETLLLETLTEMKEGAKAAGGFVVEQAPDLIQQLLAYEFWSAALFAIVLLGTAILMGFLARWIIRRLEDGAEVLAIFPAIVGVVCMVGAFSLGAKALKIRLAPKVFIVEYAAKLLKDR